MIPPGGEVTTTRVQPDGSRRKCKDDFLGDDALGLPVLHWKAVRASHRLRIRVLIPCIRYTNGGESSFWRIRSVRINKKTYETRSRTHRLDQDPETFQSWSFGHKRTYTHGKTNWTRSTARTVNMLVTQVVIIIPEEDPTL